MFVYIYGNIIHLNANTLQQGDLYENKNRNNTRVLTVWKTNFINSMIKNCDLQNETIVVIQDEFGQSKIKNEFVNSNDNMNIINIENTSNEEINEKYINKILEMYSPHRIFIEVNGMKNSNSIINMFNNKI